jgi:AraC-like DNA-binding protein
MSKNLDDPRGALRTAAAAPLAMPATSDAPPAWLRDCLRDTSSPPAPGLAVRLREGLAMFATRAAAGALPLQVPHLQGPVVSRGEGHFHLGAELFLQLAGTTRFQFPQAAWPLVAGQALLVPPTVRHSEWVSADGPAPEQAFANLVIYADAHTLSCHLANEVRPGQPGILHLEARRHALAGRIHDWLADAAACGAPDDPLAAAQARALVAAALAAVQRALADDNPAAPPEPALVARVRVLVQNQLGEHTLSVRGLADECGCTPDYLSHLFRQVSGEALVACINRLRMERAARLLADSALAGKEVAWACGFASQSYFIRTFRTHFGVTPKAYRVPRQVAAPQASLLA